MIVKIYKPAKNAMQSGKSNSKKWRLEYQAKDSRYIEPVMGWTGSSDTQSQVILKFDTKDDAIAYAKRNGFEYNLVVPKKATIKFQSYAETLM